MEAISLIKAARPSAALLISAASALITAAFAPPAHAQSRSEIERGRYLVKTAGCNDCHTHGYAEAAGTLDEKHWLTGSGLGWRGPWRTTYASNLRIVAQGLTEEQWLRHARVERRPPMPWFNLRDMSDRDVTSIYAVLEVPRGRRGTRTGLRCAYG